MGYGSGYPFGLGGAPSSVELIHAALRSAMGNTPGPAGGIEDLWRRSKAHAIDIAARLTEHAAAQVIPVLATTGIPRWEVLLELYGDGVDEERRQAIAIALTSESLADIPSLQDELQARVSSRITIVAPDRTKSRVEQIGRIFLAWGAQVPALKAAAFSDESVWRVRYELDTDETAIRQAIRDGVDEIMQDRLPAWETYMLIDDGDAFYMDGGVDGTSLMDQTPIQ